MKTIGVSEFKAKIHSVLETVHKTGEPVTVTRYGVPIGLIRAPQKEPQAKSLFGCMAATTKILGDILEPLPESDWEVLR